MENFFSRLTLDIIGKAVFNYDFDSLTHDDPVIQVRSHRADCAPAAWSFLPLGVVWAPATMLGSGSCCCALLA